MCCDLVSIQKLTFAQSSNIISDIYGTRDNAESPWLNDTYYQSLYNLEEQIHHHTNIHIPPIVTHLEIHYYPSDIHTIFSTQITTRIPPFETPVL